MCDNSSVTIETEVKCFEKPIALMLVVMLVITLVLVKYSQRILHQNRVPNHP